MEIPYCSLAKYAFQAAAAEEMQTSRQGEESLLQPQSTGRNPCLLEIEHWTSFLFFESGDCGCVSKWLYSLLECSQNEAGMLHLLISGC